MIKEAKNYGIGYGCGNNAEKISRQDGRRGILLSVFLMFLIVMTTIVTAAVMTAAAPDAKADTHNHNEMDFEPWSSADSLPADSGSYYLTQDVTLDATWEVPAGENINLCLDGHSISLAEGATGSVIKVRQSTLSLYDEEGNSGTITGGTGQSSNYNGGGVYITNGTFNMYGGTITGNRSLSANGENGKGGGVYLYSGTFNMHGGNISNNTARSGGGLEIESGTATINGGNISFNSTTKGGGGICLNTSVSGKLIFNDGNITGNQSQTSGGGIYVSKGKFSINGGTVTNNTAASNGGGIAVFDNSSDTEFNISGDPEITNNKVGSLERNVYLPYNLEMNVTWPLTNTEPISITTYRKPEINYKPILFRGDKDEIDLTKFESEDPDFELVLQENTETGNSYGILDSNHVHDGKRYYKWTSSTSLPSLYQGAYYLTRDVELNDSWSTTGKFDICLNGHSISNTSGGNVIYVSGQNSITGIYDCKGGGLITGTSNNNYNTGGAIRTYGKFNLHGGTVTGNISGRSGGVLVYNTGELTVDGGNITGNQADEGAGIYVVSGGKLNISGRGTITDEICIEDQVKLGITGQLTNNNYGVYIKPIPEGGNPRVITEGLEGNGDLSNFTSKREGIAFSLTDDGEVQAGVGHDHEWSLTKDQAGNTAIVKCSAENCIFETNKEHTATLDVSDKTYDRKQNAAQIVFDNDTYPEKDVSFTDITYTGRDGTAYTESTTAPVNAGKYTAKTTASVKGVGSVTLTKDFEIKKANIIYGKDFFIDNGSFYHVYDGTPKFFRAYMHAQFPESYEISYKVTEDGAYSTSEPSFTAPGSYDVWVKATSPNYNDYIGKYVEKIDNGTIKEGDITVTSFDVQYDGEYHAPSVTIPEKYGEYKVLYSLTENGTYTEDFKLKSVTEGEGLHRVYYKIEAYGYNTYFNDSDTIEKNLRCRITKGVMEGITADNYEGEYDGEYHGITVKIPEKYEGAYALYQDAADGKYKRAPVLFKDVTDGPQTVYYKVINLPNAESFYGSATVNIKEKQQGGDPDPDPTPGGDPDPTPGGDPDPTPGGDPDPTPGGDPDPTPGGDPDPTPGGDPDPTPGGDPDPTPGGDPDPTSGGDPDPTSGGDSGLQPDHNNDSGNNSGSKMDTESGKKSNPKTDAGSGKKADSKTDIDSNKKSETHGDSGEKKAATRKKLNIDASSIITLANFKKKTMTVHFKRVKGATKYLIAYRQVNKPWKQKWISARSASSKVTVVLKKMKKKKLYDFRIQVYKKSGSKWIRSNWSKTKHRYFANTRGKVKTKIKTKSGTKAASAKKTKSGSAKARIKEKRITVKIKKLKGADGYQLVYATNKKMEKAKTRTYKGAGKTKITIKGLRPDKKYYVQIRPLKNYKGVTYVGILRNLK